MIVIGRNAAEFGSPSNRLPIDVSEIWRREFFRNIFAFKMRIFVNFDIDIHFQGHLLQELDGHKRSAIILLKTWCKLIVWCRWCSTLFSVYFPDDTFSSWKVETKLRAATSVHAHNVYRTRVPLIIIRKNRITRTVYEKTDCVFHST